MEVTKTSQLTGKTHTMELDIKLDQINAWKGGALIQDAFPNLSRGEREFIKSGITPEEWDKQFKIRK